MIQNYFKIALRNLFKNKVFSLINILGLSIGMACCMLILLWVSHELSYDKHHENAEDIYRVWTTFILPEEEMQYAGTPGPMAPNLKAEFPEIKAATRLVVPFNENKSVLQRPSDGDKDYPPFYEPDGFLVDSSYFEIFTYDFIEGSLKRALTEPNTVVLSESIARKMFPDQPALNQIIRISNSNGDLDYKITGVFKENNKPTHIGGNFFMSLYSGGIWNFIRDNSNMVGNNFLYTYVELQPGTDAAALEKKFPAFIEKYAGRELEEAGMQRIQHLQPVTEIHLYSKVDYEIGKQGNISYVYILISIALLTLLIACINFMNLSTARSGTRAAEVGIRKVMGAQRSSLTGQFVGESILMSLIALMIAIVAVELFLPNFGRLTGKELSLIAQPQYLLWFVGIALLTGLLAGSYPAFYLSSFNPVTVLKGKLTNNLSAASLRRILVVFQFVISIALIAGSIFIAKQMDFLQNQDLGFQDEQQIVVHLRTASARNSIDILKNELKQSPDIESVATATSYPGIYVINDRGFYRQGETVNDNKLAQINYVDHDYLKTLELKLAAGRFFSRDFPADTINRVILNETAVELLGFESPEAAVGQTLLSGRADNVVSYELIGVLKDYHFESLHTEIKPYGMVLFTYNSPPANYAIAQVNTEDVRQVLASAENQWKALNPDTPFEYSFLDEDFQKNYEAEQRISSIIWYFTIIAILISCLGLFGLATFTAERRTKEIGIRKVLGASVPNIVLLLSKEFMLLVIVAFVIATPIAWYAANRWLDSFAYRIDLQWWIFAFAGLIALAIAVITVSFQSVRAAVDNPIKSLRIE